MHAACRTTHHIYQKDQDAYVYVVMAQLLLDDKFTVTYSNTNGHSNILMY
jgi:hypothetical protein